MSKDVYAFLHKKFSLKPAELIADEVGTEISLQYTLEAMKEYHESQLQELANEVEEYTMQILIDWDREGDYQSCDAGGYVRQKMLEIINKHIDNE